MEDNNYNKIISEALPNQEAAFGMMDKLLEVAKPEAVYSEPVTTDGVTIITAAEYMGGLGMGFGGGIGPEMGEGKSEDSQPVGGGGGGGGGGVISARPVAAIIIEGGRVRVEPIVDATKIAIAFFTAMGAMWMAWSRMRRASRQ